MLCYKVYLNNGKYSNGGSSGQSSHYGTIFTHIQNAYRHIYYVYKNKPNLYYELFYHKDVEGAKIHVYKMQMVTTTEYYPSDENRIVG